MPAHVPSIVRQVLSTKLPSLLATLALATSLGTLAGCSGAGGDEGSSSSSASTTGGSFGDALDLEDAVCEPGSGIDCSDPQRTMSRSEAEKEIGKSGLDWNVLAMVTDRTSLGVDVSRVANVGAPLNFAPNVGIQGGAGDGGDIFANLPNAIVGDATLRFWIAESEVDTLADVGSRWIFDAASRAGCLENLEGVLRSDFETAKARYASSTGEIRKYLDALLALGRTVGQTQGALIAEVYEKTVQKPFRMKIQTDVYFPRAYVHGKLYGLAVDLLASYPAKCRYYEVGPVRRFVRNGVRSIIVNRMSRDVGIVSRLAHGAIDRALDPATITHKAGIALANVSTLGPWKDLTSSTGERLFQVDFGFAVFDSGSNRVAESQMEIWAPNGTKPVVGPVYYHQLKTMAETAAKWLAILSPPGN
ncbi:MAG: hypothetical protein U0169_23340 [Polyangiaceae bacterium]